MNMQILKTIKLTVLTGVGVLLACISLSAFSAQNNDNFAPPPVVSTSPNSAQGSPYGWWPYAYPQNGSGSLPTIDLYSSYYLPYLYSIAWNASSLVNYADFFYQLQKQEDSGTGPYGAPFASQTIQINNAYNPLFGQTLAANLALTGGEVNTILTQDATIIANNLVKVPGSDIYMQCPPGGNCGSNPVPTNLQFNADALLSTDSIDANSSNSGQTAFTQLIAFLTGQAQPMQSLTLSTDWNKRQTELTDNSVKAYVLQMRSLLAAQSLILSNFNYLYLERVSTSNLGTQAGYSSSSASPLQLEEYLVNRRVGNTGWYAAVNSAPSIAVQRETLFVLAEIQQELLLTRMTDERMLATLSSMEAQGVQYNKQSLTSQSSQIQDNLVQNN